MGAERSLVPTNRRIKRVPVDPGAIAIDADGLETIVADLRAKGGIFTPMDDYLPSEHVVRDLRYSPASLRDLVAAAGLKGARDGEELRSPQWWVSPMTEK